MNKWLKSSVSKERRVLAFSQIPGMDTRPKPVFIGLRHPKEKNQNLWRPVANPQQLALRFDDSLKMYF